jgi:hypothetical protein
VAFEVGLDAGSRIRVAGFGPEAVTAAGDEQEVVEEAVGGGLHADLVRQLGGNNGDVGGGGSGGG